MTDRRRSSPDAPGLLLALVGAVQIALVVLALARVIDPGPVAFDAVGTLAGVGMAGIAALVWARNAWPHPATAAFSLVAVAVGLVSAAVWLTLLGRTLNTNDEQRVFLLAVTDAVYTLWTIVTAVALRATWVPGLRGAMVLLVIRTVVELASLPPLLAPAAGSGTSVGAELIPALAVCFGWIVIAAWAIWLGALASPRR